MRAGAVQLNSTEDTDRNLATADRLVREAASAGAELVVLPEKWTVLGTAEQMSAAAEPLDGRCITWAREIAAELQIDLVAGSIVERVAGQEKASNTSVHVGPDGEIRAVYRKLHMFDVEVDGVTYAESRDEEPGRLRWSSPGSRTAARLGMSICYDVRFPELYRALVDRGAEVISIPAAFTLATTRDHWEVLVRARAIENQCFVVAPNQIGAHPPGHRSGGRSLIVDPWGLVLATAPDIETAIVAELDFASHKDIRRRLPALDPPPRATSTRGDLMAAPAAADKRRVILDAAVRVFARQGFHTCRVADIADEARVAYGLVYHYFSSKEEILDTLFLERWELMLEAIAEADAERRSAREKLYAIAAFIVDSYRYDPELMKVIIVEVTRAANTFGRTHLTKIREAYDQIAEIVRRGQAEGVFREEVDPTFAALAFYGLIEQVLTGWIFDAAPIERVRARAREDADRGHGLPRPRSLSAARPVTRAALASFEYPCFGQPLSIRASRCLIESCADD